MFIELDIIVLFNFWDLDGVNVNQNFENNDFMNFYLVLLLDFVQLKLVDCYVDIFKFFLKYCDKIS